MLAIWKREFKSYLHTVIGWLFMAVILFFVGLYFTATNLLYGSAYFSNVISACGFILLLAVPILTMRCLAEERKNKTGFDFYDPYTCDLLVSVDPDEIR